MSIVFIVLSLDMNSNLTIGPYQKWPLLSPSLGAFLFLEFSTFIFYESSSLPYPHRNVWPLFGLSLLCDVTIVTMIFSVL